MVYKRLIEKYKSIRKQSYLSTLGRYQFKYAFIGVGHHSLTNLYPCLESLGVPLKFIYSRNLLNAERLARQYRDCSPTSNIDDILNSPDIKGVFICTDPSQHFTLTKKALDAGKDVFVEKPPCDTLVELNQLVASQKTRLCVVGLQRRFSTINRLLAKHNLLKDANSFVYRYCTGLYPEGDALTELFIHPLDNIVQLFGEIESLDIQKLNHHPGSGFHILTRHRKNVQGMIEMSTGYAWNNANETLEVLTNDHIVHANYPNELRITERPATILKLPSEKIFSSPLVQKIFLNNNGFVPGVSQNSLVVQGFYPELKHFVSLVEQGKKDRWSDISSVVGSYKAISQMAVK